MVSPLSIWITPFSAYPSGESFAISISVMLSDLCKFFLSKQANASTISFVLSVSGNESRYESVDFVDAPYWSAMASIDIIPMKSASTPIPS